MNDVKENDVKENDVKVNSVKESGITKGYSDEEVSLNVKDKPGR